MHKGKKGSTEVMQIEQYQKKWLKHVQRMDTDCQNKHYKINRKEEGT